MRAERMHARTRNLSELTLRSKLWGRCSLSEVAWQLWLQHSARFPKLSQLLPPTPRPAHTQEETPKRKVGLPESQG